MYHVHKLSLLSRHVFLHQMISAHPLDSSNSKLFPEQPEKGILHRKGSWSSLYCIVQNKSKHATQRDKNDSGVSRKSTCDNCMIPFSVLERFGLVRSSIEATVCKKKKNKKPQNISFQIQASKFQYIKIIKDNYVCSDYL